MDKINIMEGVGHPLAQDDIDRLQSNLMEGIEMLSKGLHDGNYIISGCEAVFDGGSGQWNLSAGIIVLDGEPHLVDAQVLPNAPSAGLKWDVEESNDGAARVYADASSHYIFKTRRVVAYASAHVGGYDWDDVPRLETDWTEIDNSLLNGWVAAAGQDVPAYRKIRGRRLEFRGVVNSSAATDGILFNLPAEDRPATQKKQAWVKWQTGAVAGNNGGYYPEAAMIVIELNGDMKIYPYGPAVDEFVCLDGLVVYL